MNRIVQWLNNNRYRRYPVIENVELRYAADSGDVVVLPDDVLLDFQCTAYVPISGPPLLARLVREPAGAVTELCAEFRAGGAVLAVLRVPSNMADTYLAEAYSPACSLSAVFGPGAAGLLADKPPGAAYAWAPAEPTPQLFEPALVSVQDRHRVASLLGDKPGSVPISGDVFWEAGYGVALNLNVAARTIRINAVPGAGAGFPCAPLQPGSPGCPDTLYAVNGVYGDALGRINLAGGPGFRIIPEPDQHRITIESTVLPGDIDCGNQ